MILSFMTEMTADTRLPVSATGLVLSIPLGAQGLSFLILRYYRKGMKER